MPLYRCQAQSCSNDPYGRLIFDFEAAEPVCPKCGADGRRPEFKFTIVKREIIHLHVIDAQGPDAGFGKRRRIACLPAGPAASIAGKRATAEARAVTCSACKLSAEWKAAAAENEFETPADLDFAVDVDGAKAIYKGEPPDRQPPAELVQGAKKPGDCGCGG